MKKVRENLFEAKLNLPQEYINKVKQNARTQYGNGPTHQDMQNMGRLLNQIFPIQRGHEDELTELGKEIIQKFYGPVIEGVELDVKIVDPNDEEKLEMAEKMLQEKQEEEEGEDQQEIEMELPGIENDIDKRKFINNVMQGEAQNVHDMMYDMKDRVTEITGSDKLLDLYMEFLALNKKFDWDDRVNLEQMMQQAPEMANAMETEWEEGEEGEGDKPKIKARVLDLPMLVHETVKGIYELIAAGAIDPDPVRAQKVLQATDTLSDEQQDIRYGPYIAKDLRDYVNKVAEKNPGSASIPNLREFVFGKMIEMPAKEFVELMTAILMGETGPEKTISKFIQDIQNDFKSYQTNQVKQRFEIEPDEDEDLPAGAEEFADDQEDDLLKMIQGKGGSKTPEAPQEKKPKFVDLGINALNVELNKAIDKGDWETAKEIQQMIERKGGMKESLNESLIEDIEQFENEFDYIDDTGLEENEVIEFINNVQDWWNSIDENDPDYQIAKEWIENFSIPNTNMNILDIDLDNLDDEYEGSYSEEDGEDVPSDIEDFEIDNY